MPRSVYPPYAVPAPGQIGFGPWWITTDTESVSVTDDLVQGWDHTVDLEVGVEIDADPAVLVEACSLGDGSRFRAVLGWHATGSGLRGLVAGATLDDVGRTIVRGQLDGPNLGGILRLTAVVVLERAVSPGRVAPTEPGSVLIRDHRSWTLEGIGSRFPVELVDFRAAGIRNPSAAWVLRWDRRDPEWDAHAAVRFQLNSGHPLVALMKDPDAEGAETVHSVMRRDLLRELVIGALDLDGFSIEVRGWPEGSLGEALSVLISGVFPDLSIEEVRALRNDDPAGFEAVLQGVSGFLQLGRRQ